MKLQTIDSVDVSKKRVLLRVDFNVPIKNNIIIDTARIESVVPTIEELCSKKAKVILLTHLGDPKGKFVEEKSLEKLLKTVEKILNRPINFSKNCIGKESIDAINKMKDGDILLLENTRFHIEEEENDPIFAKNLSLNGDIYINDAFSVSHRSHASIKGIASILPSYIGRLMEIELKSLKEIFHKQNRPFIAIIGGSKISTKVDILKNLVQKVDILAIGGSMANVFLKAKGINIKKSICEDSYVNIANDILKKSLNMNCNIVLPNDVIISKSILENSSRSCYDINVIPDDGMILDIGNRSIEILKQKIDISSTLIWNGPLGLSEVSPFHIGTVEIAKHINKCTKEKKLISIVGGGDTIAILKKHQIVNDFTYLSMAGGAFLCWIEGKELPGLSALYRKN